MVGEVRGKGIQYRTRLESKDVRSGVRKVKQTPRTRTVGTRQRSPKTTFGAVLRVR